MGFRPERKETEFSVANALEKRLKSCVGSIFARAEWDNK